MATASTKKASPKAAPVPQPESSVPSLIQSGASVGSGAVPTVAPLPAAFLTEPNSPFPDGYSIARERELLGPHIAEGLEDKPFGALYDRYIELLDREDRVRTLKVEYERNMGADHEASREEAIGMRQMGRLVDDTVDQMEVHTLEAYRLFLGRRREPGTNAAPIIGGKKMGAVLRSLWLLTGRDNPYADWSLIRHEHAMKEVHAKLQKAIADAQALLAAQQKWGMTLSILRSEQPKVLNLGFRSPYGYAVMQLIGLYDFFIRLMKTLERKSLRTDEVVRQSIADVNRTIRRVWYETARFDRWLSREEIKDLCRSDFAEGIGEDGAKRAQFALEVFGAVPSDVFGCVLKPTHSRRHLRESPEERKFLAHMRLQLARAEAAEEEGEAGGIGTEGASGAGGSS